MVKKIIPVVVIFICLTSFSFAQNQTDTAKASSEFSLGVDLYNSGQYSDAHQIFKGIISGYVYNPQTTISYVFDGKSLLQLKKYSEADSILSLFISRFPGSNYIDEARLTLAKLYFERNNYLQTFKELSKIIETTASPFYSSYAKSTGEKIALNYLNADDINKLCDSTESPTLKPYLLLLAVKYYLTRDDLKNAEGKLTELTKLFPGSEEKSEAGALYKNIPNQKSASTSGPVIGVMLPLNSNDSAVHSNAGAEILEGIKYAVAEYNRKSDLKIGLLIRNTERKKSEIEKIEKEFSGIPSLKVIIGPIFSDEVRETLEEFKGTDIPIISPTATENDLTKLYPNFFQANPSFTIRGKVMAEYIYYVENKRRMAVFNANQGYSQTLGDAFIKEFEKLGGKVIIRQTYNSNSVSYSEQVSKIAADSSKLEGIYLPLADKRDVPIILSQFSQSNLNLPIYGNQDWLEARGYESSSTISNNLTFSSDYFIDYTDSTFREFNKSFLAQTNTDVDRNVLYGYDTAEYLLKAVKDFDSDRKTILSDMESGYIYNGFHNNYYFNRDRVNDFLNIIRYKDGKFQLVDKFKLSN